MSSLTHKDLPVYSFESKEIFYEWLGKTHESGQPFWLRYYKKDSGVPTVVHIDAVDVALCWGWVDGLINKYDDVSYVVRYTPRRPKSVWSQVNVAKVERLIAEGLMQPSGLAHVESAKQDGRWEAAYAGQSTMDIPQEFKEMLGTDPDTKEFYESLSKPNKFAVAYRIAVAVGADKKAKVMQKLFAMLQDRKTFH